MRLALKTLHLADTLFTDTTSAPPQHSPLYPAPSKRWYRHDTGTTYYARINTPHPRTIHCPTDKRAYIHTPAPPYHRWRIGAQGLGKIAAYGTRKYGDYALVQIVNLGTYTETTINPRTIPYLDTAPNACQIFVNPNAGEASELYDLHLWSVFELTDLLTELTPIQSQYDLSLFTPLAEHSFLAKSLAARSYQLTLLIPRNHEYLPYLAHIQEQDTLELEHDGVYLPCSVQSVQSRPAGGALWEITIQLQATQPYAYRPERWTHTETYMGERTVGYNLPGNAPTPTELRLLYPTNPPDHTLEIYNHSTGDYIALKPDAAGIWSLYDNGRIYHFPNPNAPSDCTDRTDALTKGALPLILEPAEGLLVFGHPTNAYPTQVTLAAYPRYHPNIQL